MSQAHIRTLDLNLLKVFEALLEEGGVTAAGRRLGLTQSAVSHALNRLRHQVGDPLFIRTPRGMQPTPRALEIGGRLRGALLQVQEALGPVAFTPAESRRRFTVATGDYVAMALLPDLAARLEASAPNAELRVVSTGADLIDDLDQGRLDAALGVFGRVPERYDHQVLFQDRLVWTMAADHPLARAPLTVEGLARARHLVVGASDPRVQGEMIMDHGLERQILLDGGAAVRAALEEPGVERQVAAVSPTAHTALTLLSRSSMVSLLPRRLVASFAEALRLKAFDPPHAAPNLDVSMIWRRDWDSPAAAWMRGQLIEAAEAIDDRPI